MDPIGNGHGLIVVFAAKEFLEPWQHCRLVLLIQVAHHVAKLVHLAALDDGLVAEYFVDCLAKSLPTVDHDKQTLLEIEPAFDHVAKHVHDDVGVLGSGL